MEGESKKPVWFEEKRSLCPKARKRRGKGNREAASVPESKKEGNRGYRKQRNEPHIPHPHKKIPEQLLCSRMETLPLLTIFRTGCGSTDKQGKYQCNTSNNCCDEKGVVYSADGRELCCFSVDSGNS